MAWEAFFAGLLTYHLGLFVLHLVRGSYKQTWISLVLLTLVVATAVEVLR